MNSKVQAIYLLESEYYILFYVIKKTFKRYSDSNLFSAMLSKILITFVIYISPKKFIKF